MKIPITKTYFGPEEMEIIQKPLETGWVVQGPYVRQFEQKFCEFTNAKYSIATTSCTTALHIAVAVLGLKPGDEVIVPAFTWVATANVVEYMGAKPIFCDIDIRTFNIDANLIESLITPKTVGIIPVHLFGLCADMKPIMEIAKKHNLWVVEDAACSFGAFYNGQHSGTFGDFGCFSFHPRKAISTGEGGMLTTEREDFDKLSRSLRDHGASVSDLARHTGKAGFLLAEYKYLGYNYRMTDIQGALGCAQMDRAKWILSGRARRAKNYDSMLNGIGWLVTPLVPDRYIHGYQSYVCLFAPEKPDFTNVQKLHDWRNDLMIKMEEKGIATRQGTHAPVIQEYYVQKYNFKPEQFPNSYIADRLTISLPLYPQMTDDEQEFVVNELMKTFAEVAK